jgi:hypothetical protein
MQTEPSKTHPPKGGPPTLRRRFQFSLRTLMIVVTLFCVAVGGYGGWQAKIVMERKAIIRDVGDGITWGQNLDDSEIPLIRRWLGDHAFLAIWLNERMPDEVPTETIHRIVTAFPEARIEFGAPNGDGAHDHSATKP